MQMCLISGKEIHIHNSMLKIVKFDYKLMILKLLTSICLIMISRKINFNYCYLWKKVVKIKKKTKNLF